MSYLSSTLCVVAVLALPLYLYVCTKCMTLGVLMGIKRFEEIDTNGHKPQTASTD